MVVLFTSLLALHLYSAAPDINSWVKGLESKTNTPFYPKTFSRLSTNKKKGARFKRGEQIGFMKSLDSSQQNWNMKLNSNRKRTSKSRAIQFNQADLLLIDGDQPYIHIYKNGELQEKKQFDSIHENPFVSLGWSGVILEKKNEYVLTVTNKTNTPGSQALVIGNSNNTFFVNGKKDAVALLTLIQSKGNHSIYKIEDAKTTFQIGSKIITE